MYHLPFGIQGNGLMQRESIPWNWRALNSVNQNFKVPMLVCWLPSPMGVLKLNFDASVTPYDGVAAFIIRDYYGRLVQAGGKKLPPSTVPYAELIAA